jgi:hypothetical protein
LALRLLAVTTLCCGLALPLTAVADTSMPTAVSSSTSVSVEVLGASLANPDAWTKPPLLARLVAQGPGVVWYRFGAGPGPWQRSYGYVVIPEGKQTLSTVLVAPDGMAGPVSQLVTRSDIHAYALAGMDLASTSQTSYAGAPEVAGTVSVRVFVGPHYGTIVRRLGGLTRYGTSAAISASAFTSCNTIVFATGQRFPDALTASGLAGALNAPVLLLSVNDVPADTKAEIIRLKAKHAIICGGPNSVNNRTAKKLRSMGMTVERISGATRYEVAVGVSQRIQKLTGRPNRVFIARGDRFADALVISPLAYASRAPILLTPTKGLWKSTASRLSAAHYKSAVVVGSSMSGTVQNGIKKRVPAVEVWGGNGAYDTAVQVAAHEVLDGTLSWKYVGVSRGDIFPDALCGGAIAGKAGGVILLTQPSSLDPGVADAMTAHAADVKRCEIYGSHYAVSDGVMSEIQAIFH